MLRTFETSKHAKLYAKFRPEPPASLISRVVQFVRAGAPLKRAVDVGCGSGQNTRHLVPHFRSVLATDMSPAQIAEATARNAQDTVQYRVSPAGQIPVLSGSVQLVAASVCYHFFDKPRFLAEVDRVLAPGGVVALYSYGYPLMCRKNGRIWAELDSVVQRLIKVDMADFWPIPYQNILDSYQDAVRLMPYPDVVWDDESHYQETPMSVDAVLGEISSRSSFQNMVKSCGAERAEAALRKAGEEMLALMAANDEKGDVSGISATFRHQYRLVMARKPISPSHMNQQRCDEEEASV